jgi:hypothetical protein
MKTITVEQFEKMKQTNYTEDEAKEVINTIKVGDKGLMACLQQNSSGLWYIMIDEHS